MESESTRRMKRQERAKKLTESWELMRERVTYIKWNSELWKKRSAEETKRIKTEEKTSH